MFVKEPQYRTNFHLYKRKEERTLSVLKKINFVTSERRKE